MGRGVQRRRGRLPKARPRDKKLTQLARGVVNGIAAGELESLQGSTCSSMPSKMSPNDVTYAVGSPFWWRIESIKALEKAMKFPSFLYGRYVDVRNRCRRRLSACKRGLNWTELVDGWLDTSE